jgi:hypothetical protein
MYIDPIHAGPVALAHALALAARAPTRREGSAGTQSPGRSSRRRRFKPLMRLARWWRQPNMADLPAPDPAELMMWSECAGRPYATALGGLLVAQHFRRRQGG